MSGLSADTADTTTGLDGPGDASGRCGLATDGPDVERFYADGESVSIPRLAAVAWHGFEETATAKVYFETGIGWDVREENMVLASNPHRFKHKTGDAEPVPDRFPDREGYDSQAHFERYQSDRFMFDTDQGKRYTSPGGESVYLHRLAAVAWFGYDAVAGNRVRHDNGVKWDTREANLSTCDSPHSGNP